MGKKGRQIAEELYAEERVADKLISIYALKSSLCQTNPECSGRKLPAFNFTHDFNFIS